MEKRFNRGFRDNSQQQAPIQAGEEFDVVVESVGEKGDGLARKEGFVLFVPNTKAGDNVKVRVTKVLRNVGFAEVIGTGNAPAPVPREKKPRYEERAAHQAAPQEEQVKYEDTEDF